VRESNMQTDVLKDDRVYLAPSISCWRGERSTLTLLASYQHDKTGSSQQVPAAGRDPAGPPGAAWIRPPSSAIPTSTASTRASTA
jgi:iron complex outermembrane receptor protein